MTVYAEHPECDTGGINPAAAIACNLPWFTWDAPGAPAFGFPPHMRINVDGRDGRMLMDLPLAATFPDPVAPLSMEEADIVTSGMLEPTTGGNP